MVLANSHRVPRVPWYLGAHQEMNSFRLQGYHLLWPNFPVCSAMNPFCNSLRMLSSILRWVPRPRTGNACQLTPVRFGLVPFRSPLLWESFLLSVPRATKMFQFAPLARSRLCIHLAVLGHYPKWVSPFGNPRIKACLTAPRGLSQPSTSFFAGRRQGIHHMPLVAWSQNLKELFRLSQIVGYTLLALFSFQSARFQPLGSESPAPLQGT